MPETPVPDRRAAESRSRKGRRSGASSFRLFRLDLLAVAALLFSTTAVSGPLTGNGTQPPLSYSLWDSAICAVCHGGFSPSDYEPADSWAGSMMAQASRDPLFWAALDVANHDVSDVGDWCLRCHVPRGWLAGRSEAPGGSPDGCGLQGTIDLPGADFEGVSCHLCHRMMVNSAPPLGQDSLYLENGQFWIDDSDCDGAGEPCRRGPYDYPADGLYPPPHAWKFSPYHESSAICGTCHNVTSPAKTLIDAGTNTGIPFPIERTHAEWRHSDFGDSASFDFKTCQGCHMPQASAQPAYACTDFANNHAGDLPAHEFAGGNAWVPDVLRQEYPMLGLSAQLARTRDWALDMLQNRSATIHVLGPDSVGAGGNVQIDVRVTNLTGHKLPTGYPEGRRMWINVQIRDSLGRLVWESGAYDASTGILTRDAQVKVYETKQGIWNRNGTNECDCENGSGEEIFHFALNDCIKLDNRIPPKGFTGGSDPELMPRGYSYPETFPGSGELVNFDVTSYVAAIPHGTPSPLTVSATLRYQTASKEYVEFLLSEAAANEFPDDCIPRSGGSPNLSRGEVLHDFWERYDRSPPVDMTTDSKNVIVVPAVGIPDVAPIASLRLDQNVPNPARESSGTRIAYALPADASISLEILDVGGRRVRTLFRGFDTRGPHSVHWDGRDDSGRGVAAGAYLYRLEVAERIITKRMILLR
jgi:hypothetical protein